ncbi:hypothetical protein [Tsukamurella tyrosinosolvens]|uniref:hypothetical protein n=1 Tax=Tsukamurella tyrosinosolvens TaxID=57704 RepID=UPI003F49D79B
MHNRFIPVAALAAALILAACGTTAEPTAAPSSSAAAPAGSAVQEYRTAQAEEAKQEMRLHVAAALPHDVDRRYAEAASKDGVPFTFTYGEGCSLVRLPDKSLWSLNRDGGSLTRDLAAEERFGSWPGAGSGEGRPCPAAAGIPTADDPSQSGPYRWTERGFQRLRINGAIYAVPAEIPVTGTVLRYAVVHGPAPTLGEVVPGVDGAPIPTPN